MRISQTQTPKGKRLVSYCNFFKSVALQHKPTHSFKHSPNRALTPFYDITLAYSLSHYLPQNSLTHSTTYELPQLPTSLFTLSPTLFFFLLLAYLSYYIYINLISSFSLSFAYPVTSSIRYPSHYFSPGLFFDAHYSAVTFSRYVVRYSNCYFIRYIRKKIHSPNIQTSLACVNLLKLIDSGAIHLIGSMHLLEW